VCIKLVTWNKCLYPCVRFFHSIYSLVPRLMHMYVADKYQALGTTKHSPSVTMNSQGRPFQRRLDSLLIKISGDEKSSIIYQWCFAKIRYERNRWWCEEGVKETNCLSNGHWVLVWSGLQLYIVQNNCPYFIHISRKNNTIKINSGTSYNPTDDSRISNIRCCQTYVVQQIFFCPITCTFNL